MPLGPGHVTGTLHVDAPPERTRRPFCSGSEPVIEPTIVWLPGQGVGVIVPVGVEVKGVPVEVGTGVTVADVTQLGNLNDPMRVFHPTIVVCRMNSVVYQKVQSSTGSRLRAL